MSVPAKVSVAPATPDVETAPGSLSKVLARGSAWALAGYAASQVIRLGSNLILWRLLLPDAFGLMAIVSAVMQGLAMFSDIGIGPSIIQHERGDEPNYLNTAWTIQVVRGTSLFVLAMAAAVPVARFYGKPQLGSLIIVVALGLFISGLNSTKLFTATRKIALGRLTVIDLSSQFLGLIVTVAVAYETRSIWAIVWGGLAASLLKLGASHLALPGIRNKIYWDRHNAAVLMKFGRWVFFSTLLTFAAMQSDRLIFGKLVSIAELGVYNIANVWASIPLAIVGRVFDGALFPALCRFSKQDLAFERTFQNMRRPWLILAGWLCSCLIAGGPALIRFLYDRRAADAEWIVQILAASMWLFALENANGAALLARGYPKFVAAGNLAKLLAMIVLIPVGMKLRGFPGAVVGYALSELFRYVVSVVTLWYLRVRIFRQDAALTGVVLATAGTGLMVAPMLRGKLASLALHGPRAAAFVEAATIAALVGVVWGLVLLRHRARMRSFVGAGAAWQIPV
jgi:O-antigen/teichoic acid export membrane protein